MSESPIFAPNTCQVPNVIFDYWMSRLTDTQFKVLMAITRKTLGWCKLKDNISSSQIEALTGFATTAVRSAIKVLEHLNLILVIPNFKENGEAAPNTYVLRIHEIQESSKSPAETGEGPPPPRGTVPRHDGGTKPKTKPTMTKGNDYESSPFQERKGVNGVGQKFPLKKEQQPFFDQMKALDLGIPDEKITQIVRKYTKEPRGIDLLNKAISHIQFEIDQGTVFIKPKICMFNNVLNGKMSAVSFYAKENGKVAQRLKEKYKWGSLTIKPKFVICEKTQKEVPLDQTYENFMEQMENLYNLSKAYGG